MITHHKPGQDPHLDARMKKLEKRDRRVEHIFRRVLHFVERIIATITILALMAALALEVYHMISTGAAYFEDTSHMLHNLLIQMLLVERYQLMMLIIKVK